VLFDSERESVDYNM